MARPRLHRALLLASALAASGSLLSGGFTARAASNRAGGPPPGMSGARPTISGQLVAKPITGEGPKGAVVCGDRDRTPQVRALTVRGLVICSDAGTLVLIEISPGTRLYNRNWRAIGVAGMSLGDHLNAWGVLQAGGQVLFPTTVVQDTSRPVAEFQTVTGTLVAKPIPGAGPTGPVVCRDRDRTPEAQALVARGLVICTEEGNLVLLELSGATRITTRDGARTTVTDLTVGDSLTARGLLITGGAVLNPTTLVRDNNLQLRNTASQDFIVAGGQILTLDVLQSAAGGPVEGQIRAEQRGTARVIGCGGRKGTWSELRQGLTVDITSSIFNLRLMAYVDTDAVRVVSCA